jgi:hypothetical protein
MNHNYQKVVETMQEVGIDESYIRNALRLYGFEEFPKSGLDERGLSKLVKTATEMFYSEASLTTRKPKKGYLPAPKIKKERAKNFESLEILISIMKKDLKDVGIKTSKFVTYPLLTFWAYPTLIRKLIESDDGFLGGPLGLGQFLGAIGAILMNTVTYIYLQSENTKLILPVFLTQVATNLTSGIYEYVRHVKNEAKERAEVKEEIPFICDKY